MNRHLIILLSCLFVVMKGYGVTLSVLPFHINEWHWLKIGSFQPDNRALRLDAVLFCAIVGQIVG
jgi:hypothetical protein